MCCAQVRRPRAPREGVRAAGCGAAAVLLPTPTAAAAPPLHAPCLKKDTHRNAEMHVVICTRLFLVTCPHGSTFIF